MMQIVSRADPPSVRSAKSFSRIVSARNDFCTKNASHSRETTCETIRETIFQKPARRRDKFIVSREMLTETMHLQCIVFGVSFRFDFLGVAAKRFSANRCRSSTGARGSDPAKRGRGAGPKQKGGSIDRPSVPSQTGLVLQKTRHNDENGTYHPFLSRCKHVFSPAVLLGNANVASASANAIAGLL
jgi:hypothetical protein